MTTLFKNGTVFTPRGFEKRDVFVSDGKVFVNSISSFNIESADSVIDLSLIHIQMCIRDSYALPAYFHISKNRHNKDNGTAAPAPEPFH